MMVRSCGSRQSIAHDPGPEFLQEDHGHLFIPDHLLHPREEQRSHRSHRGFSWAPHGGHQALDLAWGWRFRGAHILGSLAKGSGRSFYRARSPNDLVKKERDPTV